MKIENLKQKLLVTFIYVGLISVLGYFNFSCLFLRFLKIPCPGCGMMRAVMSVLRLDFISAFKFNFMFWSLPVLYLSFLFDGKLTGNKKADKIIFAVIVIGFIINWLVKIVYLFF